MQFARSSPPTEQVLDLIPYVRLQARTLVPRHLDRRDLEQDAFLAIWKARRRWNGRESFLTFNYLRMRGAMIDGLRRWQPWRPNRSLKRSPITWCELSPRLEEMMIAADPSPLDHVLQREAVQRLTRAFATLSPRDAYVLHRHYVEGTTWPTISEELGVSQSYVCKLHRRVLDHLRDQLEAA